jgi:hypothetical protein
VFPDPADRLHENLVLLLQDPRAQRFFRVPRTYRNHALFQDRTGVDSFVDQMHRATAEPDPVLECLFLRVESGKGRQEGRVDVDHPIREGRENRLAQDPEETGENHPSDLMVREQRSDARLDLSREPCAPRARIDVDRGHAVPSRPIEGRRVRLVREDQSDLGAEPSGRLRVQESLEIASPTRNEHSDPDRRRLIQRHVNPFTK